MARPNLYNTHVEPYLGQIKTWSRYETEKDIAGRLGIAATTFRRYKKEHPELAEAIKEGRQDFVAELKDALRKKALGFYYEETKTVKRKDAGQAQVSIETYKKYSPPDVAAINLLLKNYDKENWSNDPQALELRRKELEIREKQAEANEW